MALVLLAPEGDITCLRFMAHLELGDEVVFEGDFTTEPWWPAVQDRVMEILRARETP